MAKKTENKKVLRAISVGLAAMIALQPVMATEVYASDDNGTDDNVIPAPAEQAPAFTSNDTVAALETTKIDGEAAVQATADLAQSVSGQSQSLNTALDNITSEENGISNYEDKFVIAAVDTNGDVKVNKAGDTEIAKNKGVADVTKDSTPVNEILEKVSEDLSASNDLVSEVVTDISEGDIAKKAAELDGAINEQSVAFAELNSNIEVAIEKTTEAKEAVESAKEKVEDAKTVAEADAIYDKAKEDKEAADKLYEEVKSEYDEKNEAYQEALDNVDELKREYKALLASKINEDSDDSENNGELIKAKAELDKAVRDLEGLEKAAEDAQKNLAHTVIGRMVDAFNKTGEDDVESWDELNIIFKDVIKYYYFPEVEGIDASNISFGTFRRSAGDGNYLEVKVTVNGKTTQRYFNCKTKYREYTGKSDNEHLVIFEKEKGDRSNSKYYDYVEGGTLSDGIIDLRVANPNEVNDAARDAVRADVKRVNELRKQYEDTKKAVNTAKDAIEAAQAKVDNYIEAIKEAMSDKNVDEAIKKRIAMLETQLTIARTNLERAEEQKNLADDALVEVKDAYDSAVDILKKAQNEESSQGTAVLDINVSQGTVAVLSTEDSETSAVRATEREEAVVSQAEAVASERLSGVAGARVSEDKGTAKAMDSGEKADTPIITGTEENNEEKIVATDKAEEAIIDAVEEENDIVKIEEEAVPLAAVGGDFADENAKISWWWLLLIALLGATGEEMYRKNKKKKEEAIKAEIDKDLNK